MLPTSVFNPLRIRRASAVGAVDRSRSEGLSAAPGGVVDGTGGSRSAWRGVHLASPVLALALWLWGLRGVELEHLGGLGLAAILPWQYYAALFLLIVSFGTLIGRERLPLGAAIIHLVALAVVWHATPAVLYEAPRYAYTYKHLGVIARIQSGLPIDPGIDAYFNWPGYFSLNALVNAVSGWPNSFELARWAPLFYNLIYLGVVLLLHRALSDRLRHMLLGAWFFMVASWVGQDYFAPQALGYFWHLCILGILVTWFRTPRAALAEDPGGPRGSTPAQRMGLMAALVLMFAALVASHQLTPIVTLASVGVLVVFRRVKGYLLLLLFLSIQVAWFAYPASTYLAGNLQNLVDAVGALIANLGASLVTAPDAAPLFSPERLVIVSIRRWLSVFIWALAFAGLVRRFLSGRRDLTAGLLLVVPFSFIALGSYGGEMLLRIYFFALPHVAWFVAALLLPPDPGARRTWLPMKVVALSCVLAVGNAFAYYGNEAINYISADEVTAFEAVYRTAPEGSLIVTATETAPVNFGRYGDIAYASLEYLPGFDPKAATEEQVRQLVAALRDEDRPESYVVITRSQTAYARAFGGMPESAIDGLEQALTISPSFRTVHVSLDAKAFVFVPGVSGR